MRDGIEEFVREIKKVKTILKVVGRSEGFSLSWKQRGWRSKLHSEL